MVLIHLIYVVLLMMMAEATCPTSPYFTMGPANACDEYFTTAVRKNVRSFRENLSADSYAANSPLFTPNLHWNYDGTTLLTREQGVAALHGIDAALHGIEALDIYNMTRLPYS